MRTPKNTTIIYVTSNTEDPAFEEKSRKLIKENSNGLPIISVSRKPIKFGKNICIGEDSDVCDSTTARQILKGLLKAKTTYAIIVKPDCAYPPEYFTFTPEDKENFFHYINVWYLGDKYWLKGFTDSAMMCGRKFWIKTLQEALKGHRGWKQFTLPPLPIIAGLHTWSSDNAVVMLKTKNKSHFPTVLRNVLPKKSLAYWGSVENLKNRLDL